MLLRRRQLIARQRRGRLPRALVPYRLRLLLPAPLGVLGHRRRLINLLPRLAVVRV